MRLIAKIFYVLSLPISILFILDSGRIHEAYRMTLLRKFRLGLRMFWNTLRIPTGTSYKSHLAMALKLFEIPPEQAGDVLECGTWKGGAAANLSLVCQIVGRRLRIYDSFRGLPEGDPDDRETVHYREGDYAGSVIYQSVLRLNDVAAGFKNSPFLKSLQGAGAAGKMPARPGWRVAAQCLLWGHVCRRTRGVVVVLGQAVVTCLGDNAEVENHDSAA